MRATATIQIQNKPFSGVENHVKHDEKQKHSNKNINKNDTKFNDSLMATPEYIDHKTEETFGPELEIYNQKQIASRHKNNVKTLSEYVKNKKWSKRAIATFGNSELQTELLKNKTDEEKAELLRQETVGLLNYAKQFNRHNSNFILFAAVTNVDENKEEIGAPHVHLDVRPMSKTKSGKASMNINNALRAEYENDNPGEKVPKDTRKLMSWWRDKNDRLLVQEMSKALDIDFTLQRIDRDPKDMGLSMEDFQQRQDEKKENTKLLAEIDPEATIKWQRTNSKEEVETEKVSTDQGRQEAQSAPLGAIWARLNQASSYLREQTQKRLEKLRQQIKLKYQQLVQRRNDWITKTRERIRQKTNRIQTQSSELNRSNEITTTEKSKSYPEAIVKQIEETRKRIRHKNKKLEAEQRRSRELDLRDQRIIQRNHDRDFGPSR
ncbi:hypothetical protein [Fructilactobacillus sanfranciscensis]|uniref:hypothetical protein n=1 Tax=Fructilactobacillus sanfranciscensis TaxID=1625 RepID=UPI00111A0CB2|nr:hypothetical protein [Fructilactobacillus sanfranciscensis]MVF15990.1 hypothetical protein [Fructilactobacillus sanfranciscensis]TNK95143.1 hypothetical protein DKP74_06155 [Fructilactobacillus sanfranciscensis]TNK97089.1 hypothetical protein DKP75_05650 [Fructilactobacillus sanfranciscensis]